MIARPIRKDEENITATSSTNVFVYELHEYEVLLNKKNRNGRKGKECANQVDKDMFIVSIPDIGEDGVYCVASINSNAKRDPVIRTYVVSELETRSAPTC